MADEYVCLGCNRTFKKKFALTNHQRSCNALHVETEEISDEDLPYHVSSNHVVMSLNVDFAVNLGQFILDSKCTDVTIVKFGKLLRKLGR